MKLKGIKPIEQHFEKLIVIVLAVVFMLVLAMQFVVQPNMVEVGMPLTPVRPGSAYGPVAARASKLRADMTKPNPALPEVQAVDIASGFEQSLTGAVSPRAKLALGIPGRVIAGGENVNPQGLERGGSKYAAFVPPAPEHLVIGSVTNTLSPLDVQAIEGLAEYVPAQQPYDKSIITVEALFNGAAARDLLQDDPDGVGEIMAFKKTWWRNKVQILSIRLEREELTETGEWTNLSVIPALPGTVSLIDDIEKNIHSTRALETLAANSTQRKGQDLIRRPPYYRAMAGQEWKPPIDLAEDKANDVDQVRIDEFLSRLDRAKKKLEDANLLKEERETRVGGEVRSFDRLIEKREKAIEDLKDELRAMGQVFEDDDNIVNNQFVNDDEEEETPLLQDEAVRIWAHDITAEPGVTYRYRIGVVMNNPAFGRHAIMSEDQKSLADQQLAVGEMSEWTNPYEVDQMAYFFVTSAAGAGRGVQGLGGGALASSAKATVEVFRFHYGFWRRGSTGLKPGDVIVADVSNPENLYTFDFETAPKDPASGFVMAAALEPPELDDDGTPIDPPEWFVPVDTRMSATVSAQFLDVSRIPSDSGSGIGGASARVKYQAVLEGGPFSRLFVRNPATEKASDRYQRLVRSAKLGETQGQPVARKESPRTTGPVPFGNEPPPPGDPGGGGGGGG